MAALRGRRRASTGAPPGSRPPPSDGRPRAGPPGAPASPGSRARACARAASRPRPRPRWRPARSVARVPLFLPRLTVYVIAVGLPEPRLVLIEQAEPAHPFGALPEVEVGDEQPRRAAVLGVEGLALVGVGDPGLPVDDVLQR